MTSKILGGIEQAFLDYNKALSIKGYNIYSIYNKSGRIKSKLEKLENVKYIPMLFKKPYFILFPYYFFKILSIKPDMIIVHTKKVIVLFNLIGKILNIPVVLVCHNPKTRHIEKNDYIFSITKYQKDLFVNHGVDENKIFVIPNMIDKKIKYKEFKEFSNPPIFGMIGRFDPSKGFLDFVEACNILNKKGVNFLARIGGTPQTKHEFEYENVKNLIKKYNLEKKVELMGWIDKKEDFYDNIDIFILPSKLEPFGIVLLEAMMFSKPIITSNALGPIEIFEKDLNSNFNEKSSVVFFEKEDFEDLAKKMENVVFNKNIAKTISKNGYDLVNEKYMLNSVANNIDNAIKTIFKNKNK